MRLLRHLATAIAAGRPALGYATVAAVLLLSLSSAQAALVSFPRINATTGRGLTGGTGTDVAVPINVDPADGVTALDLVFAYDAAILTPTGVYRTGATNDFSLTSSLGTPGTVSLSLSGAVPLAGKPDVAWVVFRVIGSPPQLSDLTWISASLNGGAITATTRNGRVNVVTASVTFSMSDTAKGAPAALVKVPIDVSPLSSASSFDIVVRFNQFVVRALAVEQTPLSAPLTLVANTGIAGQVNITLYGTTPISGSGELVRIQFEVTGPIGAQTPLDIIRADIAEGTVSSLMDDGLFTVCGPNDVDGDTFTGCGGDCNDANPGIFPGAPDAACNGIDNDCDGLVDEGFVSQTTNCGVGACARTGQTSCVGGVLQDSCVAGGPTVEVCNLVDDDCDGTTDNAAVPVQRPGLTATKTGATINLTWTGAAFATGYDVARGSVGLLLSSGGDFAVATTGCTGNDVPGLGLSDSTPAGAGTGLWFLVRPVNCGGAGTYDEDGSGQAAPRDAGVAASPGACP